jgi:hypothetical protein
MFNTFVGAGAFGAKAGAASRYGSISTYMIDVRKTLFKFVVYSVN